MRPGAAEAQRTASGPRRSAGARPSQAPKAQTPQELKLRNKKAVDHSRGKIRQEVAAIQAEARGASIGRCWQQRHAMSSRGSRSAVRHAPMHNSTNDVRCTAMRSDVRCTATHGAQRRDAQRYSALRRAAMCRDAPRCAAVVRAWRVEARRGTSRCTRQVLRKQLNNKNIIKLFKQLGRFWGASRPSGRSTPRGTARRRPATHQAVVCVPS